MRVMILLASADRVSTVALLMEPTNPSYTSLTWEGTAKMGVMKLVLRTLEMRLEDG